MNGATPWAGAWSEACSETSSGEGSDGTGSVAGRSRRHRHTHSSSAGLGQEALDVHDHAGDAAGADQPGGVGGRHGEDEAPALHLLEHGLGRHLRTHPDGGQVVELHPDPDARLPGPSAPATAWTVASSHSEISRGVASTSTSPEPRATAVSWSATTREHARCGRGRGSRRYDTKDGGLRPARPAGPASRIAVELDGPRRLRARVLGRCRWRPAPRPGAGRDRLRERRSR